MVAKNPALGVLRNLRFRNPDDFQAGSLHAQPAVWEKLLSDMSLEHIDLMAIINEGVNFEQFLTHFRASGQSFGFRAALLQSLTKTVRRGSPREFVLVPFRDPGVCPVLWLDYYVRAREALGVSSCLVPAKPWGSPCLRDIFSELPTVGSGSRKGHFLVWQFIIVYVCISPRRNFVMGKHPIVSGSGFPKPLAFWVVLRKR